MTIDPIDAKLLNLLQQDCSASLAELGRAVGLSVSAVKERLRKLRSRGDIRAFVALVTPQTLGLSVCAFLNVIVEGRVNESKFVEAMSAMSEVQEVHRVSGEFPYMLKIWASDLPRLEEFISRKVKGMPGVIRTQTTIVLSSFKHAVTGLKATASA